MGVAFERVSLLGVAVAQFRADSMEKWLAVDNEPQIKSKSKFQEQHEADFPTCSSGCPQRLH
jgi:hypothetical protein